ncbi:hypothetical protein [Burkholderia lata]|uniref:hypothetical protein n=1 Tax=Burkholderia lata (strain ATCC 17760 / DSM 23089 / LMG 22485 / NCIMB 9086 / R18194 / 383) TaxID=482957 RepID=UPI0015830B8E|nr:hypothetical protein [Burkholderia lata]
MKPRTVQAGAVGDKTSLLSVPICMRHLSKEKSESAVTKVAESTALASMQMRTYLGAAIVVALAACSTEHTQSTAFNVNSANFATESNENLCSVYGYHANKSGEARAELTKRGVFTSRDWENIDAHTILPGMSECAVNAAYFVSVAKVEVVADASGKTISRTLVYACDKAPVPNCPYTQVTIESGGVVSVSPRSKL